MVRELLSEREGSWEGRPVVVRLLFPTSRLLRRVGIIDAESYVVAAIAIAVSIIARAARLPVFGVEVEAKPERGPGITELRRTHMRFVDARNLARSTSVAPETPGRN